MDLFKIKLTKTTRQLLIAAISMVAAGVTLYVVYASVTRQNISLSNPAGRPGAANASCLLTLTLATPKPSPSPSATPKPVCNSTCTADSECPTGMICKIATGSTVGYCRNPSCTAYSNCLCPTPSPTATPKPTPSPTPTQAPCVNCQYQVDLFYGPVIESFAGGVRYSTTKRLIASKSDFATFPGCKLNTVSPIAPPTVSLPPGCNDPIKNRYLVPANGSSYFLTDFIKLPGGYIYATIKNTTRKCTYDVGLASYKANGSNIDIQNLNDYSSTLLGPGQTVELMVKMPMNNDAPSCHYDFEKPAIYLYPETKTQVSVKVDVNGALTKTIPEYGNGWNVSADPSGLIDGKFDYLFYEARVNKVDFPTTGWVVAKTDLEKWFSDNLPKLGLNAKETAQFKEYWLARLPENKYFEIKLMSKTYLDQNMALNISPKPNTVIRLDFAFKGTDTLTTLTAPKVVTPVRSGFTVVEWGGLVTN